MFYELSFFLSNTIYYFGTLTSVCIFSYSVYAGRENLFNNQEVLRFIIIAFILKTLMFDSGVILKGEIRC